MLSPAGLQVLVQKFPLRLLHTEELIKKIDLRSGTVSTGRN